MYDASDVWTTDPTYSFLNPTFAAVLDTTVWETIADPETDVGPGDVTFVANDILLGSTGVSAGGTVSLQLTPKSSKGYEALFNGTASTWKDFITGAGASDPSARVVNVCVEAIVSSESTAGCTIDGRVTKDHVRFASDTGPVVLAPHGPRVRLRFEWHFNPWTHLEWLASEVTSFLTGLGQTFGLNVQVPVGTGAIRLYAIELMVVTCAEKRLATGEVTMPMTAGWYEILMLDPANYLSVSPWSKNSGTQYWLSFHLGGDGGAVNASMLGSGTVVPEPGAISLIGSDILSDWTDASLPYRSTGPAPVIVDLLSGLSAVGPDGPTTDFVTTAASPSVVLNVGGSPSPDSMPYVVAHHKVISSAISSIDQDVSGGDTYNNVVVLLMTTQRGGVVRQVDPLTISVTGGGTVDVQPSEVKPGAWTQVRRAIGGTGGGTISLSSNDLVGWWTAEYQTLSNGTYSQVDAAMAYGGTPMVIDGSSQAGMSMIGAMLQTTPSAPSGAAAVLATQANQPGSLAGTMNPAAFNLAQLTYTSGAGTPIYEIQRSDTVDTVWRTIGFTTLAGFNDYELRRGIETTYRVRVQDTMTGFSDWTTFDAITIAANDCAVVLGSNIAGGFSLAYICTTPSQWQVDEANRVVFVQIDGRDTPVAFREPERSGDAFTLDLQVAFNDGAIVTGGAVRPGRSVFDAAVSLLHNPLVPYVAVCDWNGNVWFASPQIQQMEEVEARGHYHLTVKFTTVSAVPYPVVITV